MVEVLVRRAGPDDAFVVAALHLQYALDHGADPDPGYVERFALDWDRHRHERPVWIAESRGQHAGVLSARRVPDVPWPNRPDSSRLLVDALFVAPTSRSRGVGRALVAAMIEWSRSTDVRSIRVEAEDESARTVAEHLGFVAARSFEFSMPTT